MPYSMSFDGPVLVIRLHGYLTLFDLDAMVDDVLGVERGGTFTPPRLTDLRGVSDTSVRYPDLATLATRTRGRPLSGPLRSAIVVGAPVQLGYARMFQTLNEHPRVTVQIFEDEASARAWVDQPPAQ